jgi:hypothetical protein
MSSRSSYGPGPEVAAAAGQAGAQLEERGAVDHALALELLGDLTQRRALRDAHPDAALPVAGERLEQRVGEPGGGADDEQEHDERDEAAPVAAAVADGRAPASQPTPTTAGGRAPDPIAAALDIGCGGDGLPGRRQRAALARGTASFAFAARGLTLVGAPSPGDGRRSGAHRRDPADGRAR